MNNIKTCADFTDDHCALHPQCHGCPAHKKPTNYDRIRNMSVEEMAKEFAMFVWKTVCECDQVQQRTCEHYGMPDGGCIQCITNDIEEWLESEVTE